MTEYIHPIRLEQVLFTRSVVIAVHDYQSGDAAQVNPAPESSIDLTPVEGQEGRYQVSMSSKFNIKGESAYPYIIDMECIGVFFADTTLTKEEAVRGITITAHSVLYGAIREAVAWITGRQPFGQLMLGLSILRPTQQEQPKK
jgi:preprotein translocase subunit SecB